MRLNTRIIKFTPGVNPYAAGSVIAEFGQTKIMITATVEESVPPFLKNTGKGWITAEYAMLPGATHSRVPRERKGISGRSQEIQRLIGRSLRMAIDLNLIGERSITIDCDVLVADGGTRTASITGGYIALHMAIEQLLKEGKILKNPMIEQIAAISVGIDQNGKILADLNYEEDSQCETDMNIVMTKKGHLVEIQGTAEKSPFSPDQLLQLMSCAQQSLKHVFEEQDNVLKGK